MLTDTSVINEPPTLKSIPEFELSIDVTPQFINKFIAGKGALSETDNFTVITDGSDTKLIIGYSSVNTNRVTIPVTTSKSSNIGYDKNISLAYKHKNLHSVSVKFIFLPGFCPRTDKSLVIISSTFILSAINFF